jgi:tRNA dimethylallyltransferase
MAYKAVFIVGPTASGKSAAAVEAAKVIGGEIISADSMQIYKGMDIGTAKPTEAEMQGIPHHLIGEIEPDEPYSVSLFQKRCLSLIEEITARGKLPMVVGGTGLYVNAIVCDLDFAHTSSDDAYREELKAIAAAKGTEALYGMLREASEEDAARIHPNDQKRIIRRLEILHAKKGEGAYDFLKKREGYDFVMAGLTMERAELYRRINERVDKMMEAGLVLEVRKLYERYGEGLQSLQAIGYKEIISAIKGERSFDEAADEIKKATRNFAKRQMTWFNRDSRIRWFDTLKYPSPDALARDIAGYIA